MSNLKQGLKKLKAKGLKKGSKKKFPDLSGDGKVTMKDILMGRGVVKADRGTFLTRRLGLTGPLGKAYGKTIGVLQGVKTTKGMTKAEINKLLEDIKDINKRGVASPKSKKRFSDTTKVASGAGAALAAVEIDKRKKQKAVKKRGPKKKDKTSKADIIGKGAPKGRAEGGAMRKSVDMKEVKKKVGKDRITVYDVQEALKLLDLKNTPRGSKTPIQEEGARIKIKDIESRMKKALGKAQGGSAGPLAKTYKDIKKRVGKDRITLYDVQEAKLKDSFSKAKKRAGKDRITVTDVQEARKLLGAGKKAQGGMVTKGQGAAIRGTKFKGTF